MKHLRLFENESKRYHTFTIFDEDDRSLPEFYIFEDDKDAFNFLANKVYEIFEEYDLDLTELNECERAVDLIEKYEDRVSDFDKQLIYYSYITPSYNIQLDNWIELEKASKKYNL